jgi:hypothetical protein
MNPEKPVAGQPEGKAPRVHLYRRAFDRVHWEAGYVDCDNFLHWVTVLTHDSPEAAAIAATRLNGNEPEVDGGELFQ